MELAGFDAPTISAWFAGLVLLVGALATAYVKIRGELREIHDSVNSNMDRALTRIDDLNAEITRIRAGIVGEARDAAERPAPRTPDGT